MGGRRRGRARFSSDVDTLDDQLVLGIQGTLSVVELEVIRMRLLEGAYDKAARGRQVP